jgi:hypothetical protein
MARTILTEIAFFLAPFAAYAVVLLLMRKDARAREHWGAKIVLWLAAAGILLVALSLLWLAHYGGYRPSGTYIPAHIDKDGKFVPGETK